MASSATTTPSTVGHPRAEAHAGADSQDEAAPLVTDKAPLTAATAERFSILRPDRFLASLARDIGGGDYLVALGTAQFLMKGAVGASAGTTASFVFRERKIHAARATLLGGVIMLPWAMKPAIGLVSDSYPVFGFRKRWYMAAASLLSIAALLSLSMASTTVTPPGVAGDIVVGLFIVQLANSTIDLLSEAMYAEKLRQCPSRGPDLISYVWGGLTGMGLLVTLALGPLISESTAYPFAVAVFCPVAMLLVLVQNMFSERRVTEAEARQRRHEMLHDSPCLLVLTLSMLVATVVLSFSGMFLSEQPYVNAAVGAVVIAVLIVVFCLCLNETLAKVNSFFVVQTALSLNIGGGSYYFFTDSAESYPDGPHFSAEFYVSVLGSVASVFTLVGIVLYNKYCQHYTYHALLISTNVVASLLATLDIVQFKRLNKSFGIPDTHWVLGSACSQLVVGQLLYMPGVVLLGQLCPKNQESVTYALLAGAHNIGTSVSAAFGGALLEYLNVRPDGSHGEAHQFQNLWKASLVSTLCPMLTIAMIPYFIPAGRQDEAIGARIGRATQDSFFERRWRRAPVTEDAEKAE